MSESDKISEVIGAATEFVKVVPIYQDAVQPVAREVGKSLQTVGQCVNLVLEPFRGLVWGYEQIKGFIDAKITEKLSDTSPEKIQTPDLMIAGPTLDALRYAGHKEELQEMFANLLANAIHVDLARNTHPAFVDIIKSLSPDEAKIIRYLAEIMLKDKDSFRCNRFPKSRVSRIAEEAKCLDPVSAQDCLWNIQRLGIICNLPLPERRGVGYSIWAQIKSNQQNRYSGGIVRAALVDGVNDLRFTDFGMRFVKACLVAPNEKGEPSPEANAQ